MSKTTEEKIDEIHDFTIRMEAVVEDVKSMKGWIYGNGWPGARAQLYVLWGAFVIEGAILTALVVHVIKVGVN